MIGTYSISHNVMSRLKEEITALCGHVDVEIEEGEMAIIFKGLYRIDGVYEESTNYNRITFANTFFDCIVYGAEGDEIPNNFTNQEFECFLIN